MDQSAMDKLEEISKPIFEEIEKLLNKSEVTNRDLRVVKFEPNSGDKSSVQRIDPNSQAFALLEAKDFKESYTKKVEYKELVSYLVMRSGKLNPYNIDTPSQIKAIAYEMLNSLLKKLNVEYFDESIYLTFRRPSNSTSTYYRILDDGKVELRLFAEVLETVK